MYSAIAKNKRNTVIIVFSFILFFTAISLWFSYQTQSWWPTIWTLGFVFVFTIVQFIWASRMAMGLAGGREITREDDRRLWDVVETLAIAQGIPMPRVFIIEDDSLNAMATGRDPKHAMVAATSGLLKVADKYELEGVMAHELAHVINFDTRVKMIVFGLVGAFSALAQAIFLFAAAILGGSRNRNNESSSIFLLPVAVVLLPIALLASIIAFVVGPFITAGVSRQREYLADASGSLMTRHPEGLMSALIKIENEPIVTARRNRATAGMYFEYPYRRSILNRALSTHPPTEKRVNRLAELGSTRF